MLPEVRVVAQPVGRRPAEVVALLRDGARLPEWSFFTASRPDGDAWVVESAAGAARLRYGPGGELGLADHVVELPDGTSVDVPVRVVPLGEGALVVFVVVRAEGVDDEAYAGDVAAVEADLRRLAELLEGSPPPAAPPRS